MRDCRCRPMLSNACTLPSDALVSRIDRPFTVFVQKVPGRKSSELCLTSRGPVSSIVLSRETRSADVYVSGGDDALGGRHVGCLVAGQFQGAAREVDATLTQQCPPLQKPLLNATPGLSSAKAGPGPGWEAAMAFGGGTG